MKNIKLEQNVNLHLVQTKKYKTITMFANFANEFTLEEKVMKTLLSYIMRDRCEKYPSKKDFGTILDLLYGANCRANTASIGNVFSFTYFGVVLNPLFTDKSLDDFIAIYKELLFFPLFSEENLKDAKNICKLIIERKNDNPSSYANSQAKKLISDNHFSNTSTLNYSDIENVTLEDLKIFHKKMINEDKIDIFVYGDFESINMEEIFKPFNFTSREIELQAIERVMNQEFKEKIEQKKISQCTLVMMYETPITNVDEEIGVLKAGNIVLGGASTSLLFQTVREKHSLCYSIYSNVFPYEGLVFVSTSIVEKNLDQVVALIKDNVAKVASGEYENNILEDGVSYVVNSIISSEDDLRSSFDFALANSIINKERTLDDLILQLQSATKETIANSFKTLELKGMYVLRSDEVNK